METGFQRLLPQVETDDEPEMDLGTYRAAIGQLAKLVAAGSKIWLGREIRIGEDSLTLLAAPEVRPMLAPVLGNGLALIGLALGPAILAGAAGDAEGNDDGNRDDHAIAADVGGDRGGGADERDAERPPEAEALREVSSPGAPEPPGDDARAASAGHAPVELPPVADGIS